MSNVEITVVQDTNESERKIIRRTNLSSESDVSLIKINKDEIEMSFRDGPLKKKGISKNERRLRIISWIGLVLSWLARAAAILFRKGNQG
jgi:hypothetical protein